MIPQSSPPHSTLSSSFTPPPSPVTLQLEPRPADEDNSRMSNVDRKVVLWLVGGGVNLNCEDMGNKTDKRGLHVLIWDLLRYRK